ncbi:MAG: type II toxin-antitoxin system HicB family antitoxin [Flavobacteriales bacterium]|nr:type II toxin-antitoxin system HicB family antitoxin [Flavobacteriales bacterium]
MHKYLIIIEKTETGFGAYVPDLIGCIATGNSRTTVEKNIYEAVVFHVEGLKEEGLEIPEPTTESEVLVFAA